MMPCREHGESDQTTWSLDDRFIKAVHTALKRLRRERELGEHPLTGLTAVEEQRRQHSWPDTPLGRAAALRCVLEKARQALAVEDAATATLLERRFWQGESMVRIAYEQHVAESTLYVQQEQAISALARVLWTLGQAVQEDVEDRRRHLTRNIPPPTYTCLFGFDGLGARFRAALTGKEGPWLVCIEGLGGLGKTALAHYLVTWAAANGHFADIAWETAQQQEFATWNEIERPRVRLFLTYESLLDSIAVQLGYTEFPGRPLAQKQARLQAILKEQPHLIVVDNLETAANADALVSQLQELAQPTRFLFTSRHSLGNYPGVLCLTLNELSESDSLAFMRYEGEERGISAVAQADDATLRQIHTVIGGNPLAIKLIVGQVRSLPLKRVLVQLQEATGRHYEDLYRFIYQRSWDLLSDVARRVLLVMPALAASGGYWENLLVVSGLSEDDLARAVQELVGMSLLNVGGVEEKRYTIHQLTYTFIMSDLLREWAA